MKYADLNYQRDSMQKRRNEAGKSKGGSIFFALLIIVGIAIGGYLFFKDKIKGSVNPISIVASVSAAELKETDGRTNVLLLGADTRDASASGTVRGTELTDSILVASIGKVDNSVVLISIPRDLWIPEYHSKINAIYANYGVDTLKKVIEDVLGIPIHYHGLVTFELFTKTIDTLGGISVNVDNSFIDYAYPVEGNEAASCGRSVEDVIKMQDEGKSEVSIFPCRYETLSVSSGPQTMNGVTALKYVRSRHSMDNGEGTDFARAKRQQKVIVAIRDKALSMSTLFDPAKLKGLYDNFSKNIDTNVDLPTIQTFYLLYQKKNDMKITNVVLQDDRSGADQGGLLYSPVDTTLYGGQWVLVPQTGNFSQIHAYVQKYLFGTSQ